MNRRWLTIAAVTAPGLILAGIGLSHPDRLNLQTAQWWTTMHIILVPLFPLLGVSVWVLLRRDQTPLGWAGRAAAVVYAVFYGTLDAVSGIAAGTVMLQTGEVAGDLFDIGRVFGRIGALMLFAAIIAALGSAWRAGVRGWQFFASAVVLMVSGYFFTLSHIYPPFGVASMVGLAAGLLVQELLRARSQAAVSPPAA